MQAKDLLTAITISPAGTEYQVIAYQQNKRTIPFTSLETDAHGDLILFTEANKQPLPMKELLTKLMTNRSRQLRYWDGQERRPIYGFKEEKNQLII